MRRVRLILIIVCVFTLIALGAVSIKIGIRKIARHVPWYLWADDRYRPIRVLVVDPLGRTVGPLEPEQIGLSSEEINQSIGIEKRPVRNGEADNALDLPFESRREPAKKSPYMASFIVGVEDSSQLSGSFRALAYTTLSAVLATLGISMRLMKHQEPLDQ